eukprot:4511488-Pyramimonas_sp.AAC.1
MQGRGAPHRAQRAHSLPARGAAAGTGRGQGQPAFGRAGAEPSGPAAAQATEDQADRGFSDPSGGSQSRPGAG